MGIFAGIRWRGGVRTRLTMTSIRVISTSWAVGRFKPDNDFLAVSIDVFQLNAEGLSFSNKTYTHQQSALVAITDTKAVWKLLRRAFNWVNSRATKAFVEQ